MSIISVVLLLTTVISLSTAVGWIVTARQLHASNAQLERAERDGLTGLWRREGFERRAPDALGHSNAVAILDLDRFKSINDQYGHATGDEVLRVIAERLIVELGPSALIARLGGDEFALITSLRIPALPDQLKRLTNALASPIPVPGVGLLTVGVSLGMVCLSDLTSADNPAPQARQNEYWSRLLTEALSAADLAMYKAKKLRQGWWLYSPTIDARPLAPRIDPTPRRRHRDEHAVQQTRHVIDVRQILPHTRY